MITDFQCNRVYFSSLLQRVSPKTYASLVSALEKHSVEYRLLVNTNDIWCRDYMPIQIAADTFCGFDYDPDYLHETKELLATRTDGNQICNDLGFEVKQPTMPLIVDGGNVIRCDNKIIMIEKVFKENRTSWKKLAKAIEEHFMAELVILPWDESEFYGHADGLVRYIGNDRVLITNYDRFDKKSPAKLLGFCGNISTRFSNWSITPNANINTIGHTSIGFKQTKCYSFLHSGIQKINKPLNK